MFKKLLVANRGEIACRVIRTARKMGIRTVAVYSAADKDALHVAQADEAVGIGPPPSAQSYLAIDKIVQACRDTGAEAVHPGYGFLSENALFAERLEAVGVAFIGPNVHAIRSMGDKIASKKLAQAAGVNTIPGHNAVIENAEQAVQFARDIGYPVMLKASAGGGGKGMRVAHNDAECRDGFARATNEARSSFGDDRVFLEKFIEQPRHIEIQVLADRHGNIIHLGERECSLQRRHQKVIEEAPSTFIDDKTRAAMGAQAVALARAVNYQSAGTVEFVVDAQRNFYFLEMNTRLQVEHPVTEFVTGLDLVELMIRIAAGEKLPLTQADVRLQGWAIEARVYAEDPVRNFLPSIGRLVRYSPPAETASVRVDTGVYEGGEVSMYYDPMIAKLITYGPDRAQASAAMRTALNEFYIRGVSHNIGFLAALIKHPRFRDGKLSTGLIAEEFPNGFQAGNVAADESALLITLAAVIHRRYMDRAAQIDGQLAGYERKVHDDWVVVIGDARHTVSVRRISDSLSPGTPGERVGVRGAALLATSWPLTPDPSPRSTGERGVNHEVTWNGNVDHVHSAWQFGEPLFRGTINGNPICVQVERHNLKYRLSHDGIQVDVLVLTKRAAELLECMPVKAPPDMSRYLVSPMPGLLAQLLVKLGDEVKSGQQLAVVEAMKMENVLCAERDGRVAKVLAAAGESLAVDQPILEFT